MESPASPSRRRRLRLVLRWAAFLTVLWVTAVGVLKSQENKLAFVPDRAEESWADPPDPRVRDVWLTTADGTPIHGWYLPADPAAGAILYFHGNGGNLSHRGRALADLHRNLRRSVLIVDYPGYGKSGGSPSEAGCYAAAEAGFAWLTGEAGFPAGRVVLLGESLGGGVAVEMATRHDHAALVLVYTFTSMPAAAKSHYPWAPCDTLMANRFDNLAKIGRCGRPVLVAHGTADEVIPFEQGERLYEAAPGPKRFVRFDGYGHGTPGGDRFYTEVKQFLDAEAPGR